LFTGGRLKSQYRACDRARTRLFYLGVATKAFGEVSTALSAHHELAESLKQQARSVRAYRESVGLADKRYDSGLASYFEVIDAKLELYPAEQVEVQYDLGRKVALVMLWPGAGGGWRKRCGWMKGRECGSNPPSPQRLVRLVDVRRLPVSMASQLPARSGTPESEPERRKPRVMFACRH
jgi:hypothetical protein